ncbi:MAG: hypothetical protein PUP90_29515 [Nostoc sp. S4]|nr:hypothetical protein [Nostoc sp. S4]
MFPKKLCGTQLRQIIERPEAVTKQERLVLLAQEAIAWLQAQGKKVT